MGNIAVGVLLYKTFLSFFFFVLTFILLFLLELQYQDYFSPIVNSPLARLVPL